MSTEGIIHIGLDVSKGRLDAVALGSVENPLGPKKTFLDVPRGREGLCRWIENHATLAGASRVKVGMEPTGGYEIHFHNALVAWDWKSLDVDVVVIPTKTVKNHLKARGINTKTDPICARTVAECLISHPKARVHPLYGQERDLRRRVRRIERRIKNLRALENDFLEELHENMPFLVRYAQSRIPLWLLLFVRRFPSARSIVQARTLDGIPRSPKENLQLIRQDARHQYKDLPSSALSDDNIREQVEEILALRKQIAESKKKLAQAVDKMAPNQSGIEALKTVPRLGEYTIHLLYAEVFQGRTFPTPEAILHFIGLDLVEETSGDRTGDVHLSKQGPGSVRRVLYLATWRLIQQVKVFRDYYQKQLQRRPKEKNRALIATMRKLVRVLWHLYTTGVPFDSQHEENWKEQRPLAANGTQSDPDQTPIAHDPDELAAAPISPRYRKKAKEATGRKLARGQAKTVTASLPPSSLSPKPS